MEEVAAAEIRNKLGEYLDRAEAGEEFVVLRRGKEVARLMPPQDEPKRFPDLSEFRKLTKVRDEPMSETVIRQRRESRY